ncbi:hypothetical protein AOLI_G00269030 [Acnodon oligacanthus]
MCAPRRHSARLRQHSSGVTLQPFRVFHTFLPFSSGVFIPPPPSTAVVVKAANSSGSLHLHLIKYLHFPLRFCAK